SHSEQREARLRIVSRLTRCAVGLLRVGVLAAKAVDLAALVERGTWRLATPACLTLACAARVLQGGGPFTVRPSNFRAVDQADTAEGERLGLRLAPASEGGRPFVRAVHRVHLVADL